MLISAVYILFNSEIGKKNQTHIESLFYCLSIPKINHPLLGLTYLKSYNESEENQLVVKSY